MKKLWLLVSLVIVVFFCGCKPRYGYYITARFDGIQWCSLPIDSETEFIAELDEIDLWIDYFSYEDDLVEQFGFLIAPRTGPHFLNEDSENEGYVYFGDRRDWEEYDTTNEGSNGLVWISRITETYITGWFWFKARDFEERDYVHVSRGRFKVEIEEY